MPSSISRLRRAIVFFGGLSAIAILGYHLLTGKGWLDSVYWYVITVSTVGYGEHSSLPPKVQAFSIMIILVGLTAAGYALGGFIQMMIEGEVQYILGVRRMNRKIELMKNHVVLCGFGRIGKKLSEYLKSRNIPFLIVDRNEEVRHEAEAHGYTLFIGDATEEEVLCDVGIKRAKTFIVGLQSDAENVFITLTARGLNPKLQIIACGEQPATEKKLLLAGANRVIMPGIISARRIATLVDRPHAAEIIDLVSDDRIPDADLVGIQVQPSDPLDGKTIREAAPRERYHILIVAIRYGDDRFEFSPDPDQRLQPGDTVIIMGGRKDVERFHQEMGAKSKGP